MRSAKLGKNSIEAIDIGEEVIDYPCSNQSNHLNKEFRNRLTIYSYPFVDGHKLWKHNDRLEVAVDKGCIDKRSIEIKATLLGSVLRSDLTLHEMGQCKAAGVVVVLGSEIGATWFLPPKVLQSCQAMSTSDYLQNYYWQSSVSSPLRIYPDVNRWVITRHTSQPFH